MSGAVTQVSKGRFFKSLDARLKRPTDSMLGELRSSSSLFEIGLQTKIARPSDQHHIQNEIFGDEWWGQHTNKERVVRFGYIEAVELSLQHAIDNVSDSLPIESWWYAGPDNFEVVVTKSDTHISLILVTPNHEADPQDIEIAFAENIWVVASTTRCNEVKQLYGENYADRLQVEDVQGQKDDNIKRLRVWGY